MTARTGTLYWLPRILADQTLDPTETLLLIGLADHVNADDVCWVGIKRLATYARVSYATARRRLAALEQRGVISRSQRTRNDGGDSVYEYQLTRGAEPDPPDNLVGGPSAPRRAGAPAHQGARAEPPTVEQPNGEQTMFATEAQVLVAGFESFWHAYPRSTAKGTARAAWPAAVRAAGNATVIVDGAVRYAADPNRDERFTAHAATWLRAERWADPPLPARTDQPNRAKVPSVDSDRDAPAGRLDL